MYIEIEDNIIYEIEHILVNKNSDTRIGIQIQLEYYLKR